MTRKVSALLDATDSVATALQNMKAGDTITVQRDDVIYPVILRENIPLGRKYAVRDIVKGTEIREYGLPIGRALRDIRAGELVDAHNCSIYS